MRIDDVQGWIDSWEKIWTNRRKTSLFTGESACNLALKWVTNEKYLLMYWKYNNSVLKRSGITLILWRWNKAGWDCQGTWERARSRRWGYHLTVTREDKFMAEHVHVIVLLMYSLNIWPGTRVWNKGP